MKEFDFFQEALSFKWILRMIRFWYLTVPLLALAAFGAYKSGVSKPKVWQSTSSFSVISTGSEKASINVPSFLASKSSTDDPTSKLLSLSSSRSFALSFLNHFQLMDDVFGDQWNAAQEFYAGNPLALQNLAVVKFKESFTFIQDPKTSLVVLTTESDSAQKAYKLNGKLLGFLVEQFKNQQINDIKENKEFLLKQIQLSTNPLLAEKLTAKLSDEVEKEMLLKDKVVEIVDSPSMPYEPEKPKKKIVLLVSLIASFALLAFVFWLVQFVLVIRKMVVKL